jgi:hypothetical protein
MPTLATELRDKNKERRYRKKHADGPNDPRQVAHVFSINFAVYVVRSRQLDLSNDQKMELRHSLNDEINMEMRSAEQNQSNDKILENQFLLRIEQGIPPTQKQDNWINTRRRLLQSCQFPQWFCDAFHTTFPTQASSRCSIL